MWYVPGVDKMFLFPYGNCKSNRIAGIKYLGIHIFISFVVSTAGRPFAKDGTWTDNRGWVLGIRPDKQGELFATFDEAWVCINLKTEPPPPDTAILPGA